MKKKIIISILVLVGLAIVIYIYMLSSVDVYINKGEHMNSAVKDGDILVINEKDNFKRFDIIIINSKGLRDDDYLVKRIIGLPGEKVTIKEGKVFINDIELIESYEHEEVFPESETVLGLDQFFILGDSRTISADSRIFGPVSKDRIIGTAKVIK